MGFWGFEVLNIPGDIWGKISKSSGKLWDKITKSPGIPWNK